MDRLRLKTYGNRIELHTQRLQKLKSSHTVISWLRLAVFILLFIAIFYLTTVNIKAGVFVSLSLFVLFVTLLRKHKKIEDDIEYNTVLKKINSDEYASCKGDYSAFDCGSEFIDHTHPYSYDIDLFGETSLFQYINRTVTEKGKKHLATQLSNIELSKEKIEQNQKAVAELAPLLDFRQQFMVAGKLSGTEENEEKLVNSWLKSSAFFSSLGIMKILLTVVPIFNLLSIVAVVAGLLPGVVIVWVIVTNLIVIGSKLKSFNKAYSFANRSDTVLRKVQRIITVIENRDFNSKKLQELKSRVYDKQEPASIQIKRLTKLKDNLDNRNNILVGILLNAFLLWDWQFMYRIDKWRDNHNIAFEKWLEAIAEFDSLVSFANFHYNNDSFCFPKILDGGFRLDTRELGHPLIPAENRVCNDFVIDSKQRFAIVTGANMAGKSTFLRTVAVNIVLASCGASVCAEEFIFTPIQLHTSMRNEDSLMKNESYFFAELKRLQSIVKELEKGNKTFIILDEILRGTNSEDKRKGSIEFVKKIVDNRAYGIVATHDLELARLAEQQPEVFKPLCFEVSITNDELIFNYKLQKGITQNMNASFLMKKMGIIG